MNLFLRNKLSVFAGLLLFLFGLSPELFAEERAALKADSPKQVKKNESRNESAELLPDLADNDVYLLSPDLWDGMSRYFRGELFDYDAELRRMIAEKPHHFPLYFYAAVFKLRRLMLAPDEIAEVGEIERLLTLGLKKAQRAKKLKKFAISGLYYETVCSAALATFHGLRSEYLKAHGYAVVGRMALDELMQKRPGLQTALLLEGTYHYYTGKFGPLLRFVMRLIGLPPGEVDTGLKMIDEALKQDGPFSYFGQLYATMAFSSDSKRRARALEISEDMIRRYPNNYFPWLLRAILFERTGNFERARENARKGRALLPGEPKDYKDLILIADQFLLDLRLAYENAILDADLEALRFLQSAALDRTLRYADAPALASLHLGHLASLAGLDEEALAYYKKVQSYRGVEWLKDLAKRNEESPMSKRFRLPPKRREALRTRLLEHSEIRAEVKAEPKTGSKE